MSTSQRLLLTFAVKEESRPFEKLLPSFDDVAVLITGIGPTNAEKAIRNSLAAKPPGLVLTCGFAGALNPELTVGRVIFCADDPFRLTQGLLAAGARAAKFHCAERVVVSAVEKRGMWQSTHADAVEMESGVIRAICRQQGIPSATVRVVSDAADEDLPLDFNRLLDARQNLSYGKLALTLAKTPGKMPALLKLQQQTQAAAKTLARVLIRVLADLPL